GREWHRRRRTRPRACAWRTSNRRLSRIAAVAPFLRSPEDGVAAARRMPIYGAYCVLRKLCGMVAIGSHRMSRFLAPTEYARPRRAADLASARDELYGRFIQGYGDSPSVSAP